MIILQTLQAEINQKYGEELQKEIIFDGSCIRQDHIWIYAHQWEYKSKIYQNIVYGSWKAGDSNIIKSWDKSQEKDKNFVKAYKKKTSDAKTKIDYDRKKKQQKCREKWTKVWEMCEPCTTHEYLEYKNVEPYGLKVDRNGVLLIPCRDVNGLVGVQRIYRDPETNKLEKRFSAGIKIQGAIHALKSLKNEKYCYLSEGFATAATIQKLFPRVPSVCCFNAGNIKEAIRTIREIYPEIKIIIAGDNDHATVKPIKNPGRHYAFAAMKVSRDTIVKMPKFQIAQPDWTDFNDLANFESEEKAAEQLAFIPEEFSTLKCLGHNEGNYFYISTENQQIVTLNWANHNKQGLRRLFANKFFWLRNYGIEDDDEIKVNWDNACEELMNKCHKIGIFDPKTVRGIGVWKDGDKYCINDGEKVYNENKGSIYNYQKTIRTDYTLKQGGSNYMIELLQAFKNLEYKNKEDYFYLSAWFVQAQIFAVLPWRFHIWLTGSAGAGKSTIIKWLDGLCMNNILTNNTTAAGVRQEAKSNACSIIYDEAEATEQRTKDVISLAREMSSNGGFKSLRGTVSGNSVSHNTQCVFCFGSVQISLEKQTDKSRIFTIEMNSTKDQEQETFDAISERFEYFIKHKNEIFTVIYNSIDNIIYNYNFCKARLKTDHKLESRLADQVSMAMACFWVYFSQEKMTQENYKAIVEKYKLISSDYTDQNNEKEHESCYDSLMSVIIESHSNTTIAQAIHNLNDPAIDHMHFEKLLGVFGLRYFKQDKSLFISTSNQHLEKRMPKYSDITRILKRDRDIILKEKDRVRIIQIGQLRGIRIKVKS